MENRGGNRVIEVHIGEYGEEIAKWNEESENKEESERMEG